MTVPVIIKYADAPVQERLQKVKDIIYVTRKTRALDRYAEAFSELLVGKCCIVCVCVFYMYVCCYHSSVMLSLMCDVIIMLITSSPTLPYY